MTHYGYVGPPIPRSPFRAIRCKAVREGLGFPITHTPVAAAHRRLETNQNRQEGSDFRQLCAGIG